MAAKTYARTYAQRTGDFANARFNEELVGSWLPETKEGFLTSTTKMDWVVEGISIDVKEKNQPLSKKWPLPGCEAEDAFIVDELSIRRAMLHFPRAYFVLHDGPGERWFLARLDEVACGSHITLDRVGPTGVAKGKWVCDLHNFRHIENPEADLWNTILEDQIAKPWAKSSCLFPSHELK